MAYSLHYDRYLNVPDPDERDLFEEPLQLPNEPLCMRIQMQNFPDYGKSITQ